MNFLRYFWNIAAWVWGQVIASHFRAVLSGCRRSKRCLKKRGQDGAKKVERFLNKIVDKWKVSSNDSHMGIITFGSNESLIFVLHKKYHSADALNERVCGHHISWLNQTWNLHRPCRRSGRESNIYQLRGRQTQSTLGEISHIYMYKKTNKWTN